MCIFLTAKADISNFLFATVNTITYAIYLVYWHIWGTAALEVFFYIPLNFISWYCWVQHRDQQITQKTKAKKLEPIQNVFCASIVMGAACVYHAILVRLGGEVAWFDAFTLSIGIVATILELLRYREQYVWWIITDIVPVGMYIAHFAEYSRPKARHPPPQWPRCRHVPHLLPPRSPTVMFAARTYAPPASRSARGVWCTLPMRIPFLRK